MPFFMSIISLLFWTVSKQIRLFGFHQRLMSICAGVDVSYMEELELFEKVYIHPELMSLLAENLYCCSDISEALYAVSAGNDKALLKTICCTELGRTLESTSRR